MKLGDYRYNGKTPLRLSEVDTGASNEIKDMKDELLMRTSENMELVAAYQNKLYADGREGLVVILQASDAAGKDSTVRHVFSCMNPQGVAVHSFKAPTEAELAHDYLWRVAQCLPPRGQVAVFNRSHYEDVMTVEALSLQEHFKMPARCLGEDFIDKRVKQIVQFEEYLYDNGYRVLKFFLNVSKEEQKKRLLERLDDPEKYYKSNPGDLETRALWTRYHEIYERIINETATKHAPWYVLPADAKWFTRYLVSEALVHAFQKMDPSYPEPTDADAEIIAAMRKQLAEEDE